MGTMGIAEEKDPDLDSMPDQSEEAVGTMLEGDKNDRVQLDAVLSTLGTGWHHRVTVVLLALVYVSNALFNFNYVFAVEDANYRCRVPQCDGLNPVFRAEWINGSMDLKTNVKQCLMKPVIGDSCTDLYNTTMVDCHEWVYENPHSFVAEFNLACDEWKRTLVGTVHSLGNMMGLLIQGQISDRFGRKMAAVFAGTVGAILGTAKSFSSWYWVYVFIEWLEAAIGDAFSPIFMLSIEMVEKKRAVLYQMMLMSCYTSGLIMMPLIAWAVPYWRNFLRVIYVPSLLILTYPYLLDESVRWLLSKGKSERAFQILVKMAQRNKVQLDQTLLSRLQYVDEDAHDLSDRLLLLKTFRSRIMMQRFLACMVWWFTVTFVYYGVMINSVYIEGNKYLSFTLLLIMHFPANAICWYVLTKYKRKVPLLASFLIGGIFCICLPLVTKGYPSATLALLMVFKMLATFSYHIVYLYTSELFPTYTRNSMQAICIAIGRIGSLVAPQIPLLISVWSGLPTLLFGVASIIAGVLTLLVPETANTELPSTVADAERIGKETYKE